MARFACQIFFIWFLLLPSLCLAETAFQAQQEFPNYFAQISREQLAEALASIFRRTEAPIFDGGSTRLVRFFNQAQLEVDKIDPNTKVLPSGGIVRSAISLIYSDMHIAISNNPSLSPSEVLNAIINEKEGIPLHQVRGVGSDLDILLQNTSESTFPKVEVALLNIINSLESALNGRNLKASFKRTFLAVADIKNYSHQIARSIEQGGSNLDWLAFDIQNKRFIEPSEHKDIVSLFMKGKYKYLSGNTDDITKQTIRGLRPLLELPFLIIEDETVLRKELDAIQKNPSDVSEKALEQFEKLVRNARFGGAHNRFHRGGSGAIEVEIKKMLDAVNRAHKINSVPVFLQARKIGRVAAQLPAELLIPRNQFITNYTSQGVLYHGTPDLVSGLSIIRNGLILSSSELRQGVSAKGEGAYTTKKRDTAQTYSKGAGLVFEVSITNHPDLVIFNAESVEGQDFLMQLQQRFPNQSINKVLAEQYGVDIIVNTHIIFQNANALILPDNLGALAKALEHRVFSEIFAQAGISDTLKAIKEYTLLYSLSHIFENIDLKPPPSPYFLLEKILYGRSSSVNRTKSILEIIQLLTSEEIKQITIKDLVLHISNSFIDSYNLFFDKKRNYALGDMLVKMQNLNKIADIFELHGIKIRQVLNASYKNLLSNEPVSSFKFDSQSILLLKTFLEYYKFSKDEDFRDRLLKEVNILLRELKSLSIHDYNTRSAVLEIGFITREISMDLNRVFERNLLTNIITSKNSTINYSISSMLQRAGYKFLPSSISIIRESYRKAKINETPGNRLIVASLGRILSAVDPNYKRFLTNLTRIQPILSRQKPLMCRDLF